MKLPSAAPGSWPVVRAKICRWSPCGCPPFVSFIHIYFSIYLSARTPQGRGFNISVPLGYRWKIRRPWDAGKKGRRDRYPEVRWTISVRLTDPSPTICHLPTTDTDTQTHTRARTHEIKLRWYFYSWKLEHFTASARKKNEKNMSVYLTQNRHLAGSVFMNAHTFLLLQHW